MWNMSKEEKSKKEKVKEYIPVNEQVITMVRSAKAHPAGDL